MLTTVQAANSDKVKCKQYFWSIDADDLYRFYTIRMIDRGVLQMQTTQQRHHKISK